MNLLSWNIQWERDMNDCVGLSRIAANIRVLGDFDIICLQEVAVDFPCLPGSKNKNQIVALGKFFPNHTPIYGAAIDIPSPSCGRTANSAISYCPACPWGRFGAISSPGLHTWVHPVCSACLSKLQSNLTLVCCV